MNDAPWWVVVTSVVGGAALMVGIPVLLMLIQEAYSKKVESNRKWKETVETCLRKLERSNNLLRSELDECKEGLERRQERAWAIEEGLQYAVKMLPGPQEKNLKEHQ